MIRAEQAERIMQQYEDDYDNFLDKLKAKRNAKKQKAAEARSVAERAEATVRQAEARKPALLKEKAKNLLDKAGGIEGAADTAKNVMKYFKTDTSASSDYQMSFGGGETPKDKGSFDFMKTFGIGAAIVIGGGLVTTGLIIYGIYRLVKKPAPIVVSNPPVTNTVA